MMSSRKCIFRGGSRFQAGCLAFGFTGFAMCASAQLSLWSTDSSSPDSFGGDSDSYALIKIPSDTTDWTRHFRIGALIGMNISANFSEKGKFNISGSNPASGNYDDGYVHPDQSGDPNYTSYWGYDNASQYDSAAQILTMHSMSSYSTSGDSKDNGGPFPGFDMVYGDNIWYWKHARVGWELGFGLLPITIKDNGSQSATVNQAAYNYSAAGLYLFPDPGYQGGSSGQGPIIASTYTPPATSQTLRNQPVTGTRQLNEMLYTIRLGPSFYWDLTENFGMSLGAGGAMGVVTGNYKYNETISSGAINTQNSGSFGTTDMIYGGYANGTVMYHVTDSADIYLSAQYMPLGNASFSNSGRQAELNLGGQIYVSLGVNWPF